MTYFLNLFTAQTWAAFREHGADISGFRHRQRRVAYEEVSVGDVFLCYLVGVSRWCGALRITSSAYHDKQPIFRDPDPFVIRFKVEPIVMLEPEFSLPMRDKGIWSTLNLMQGIDRASSSWGMQIRSSLRRLSGADGDYLVSRLQQQEKDKWEFPFNKRERRQLAKDLKINTLAGEVAVAVPEESEEDQVRMGQVQDSETPSISYSFQMQAKVAEIGAKMGFRIWVPAADKSRVFECLTDSSRECFLDRLPLNYDDTTLRTIQQIDVIWLKGRSIARAFEIEHTTAVYSGLLRMADLLALQPNMDIRLHIVAAEEKREKVLQEIKRPVFSLLERGPLYEKCTYLPYGAIEEVLGVQHLEHMSDSIVDEYAEDADD